MAISLVGLLIALLIVCVLFYCARLLIAAFAIPQPLATVIMVMVILIIICLFIVLQASGLWGPWGTIVIR